jgi:hypothetical protein
MSRRLVVSIWVLVAGVYVVPVVVGATDTVIDGRNFVIASAALAAWWVAIPTIDRMWPVPPSSFDAVADPSHELSDIRPQSLVTVEQAVVRAQRRAGEVHYRLRPIVQELITQRLARVEGIDLGDDRAAALAGPRLWDLVRDDRPMAADPRTRGISDGDLVAIVDDLEAIGEATP